MADKRLAIIQEQRFSLAEYSRQDWVANAEEGTTIQDIMEPGYWAHVASKMKPFDRIEVRLETGEWIAELVVIGVERNWARVAMLVKYDLIAHEEPAPAAQKHKVEWKGPQRKYAVIRLADSEAVQEGFAEKASAYEWMNNHERVTGT